MKTYSGRFEGVDDTLYEIRIETKEGNGTVELEFAGSPITVTMSSDGKNVFSPVKSTGATVNLVNRAAYFDMYSANATGTKVTLTDLTRSTVKWVGFLTPCAYNQEYDEEFTVLQLECVDALAALKDVKYGDTAERKLVSFADAIARCLNRTGVCKRLFVSDNIQYRSATAADSVIESFKVSDQCFYAKRDNENQFDIDLSWSAYEVLFEIAQYLGYTFVTEGEDVFMLDYDAIRRGNDTYFRYDITPAGLTNRTTVRMSYSYRIDGGSVRDGGIDISLDAVYNKATVKDSFYKEEAESIDDESLLTNITSGNDPKELDPFLDECGFNLCVDFIEQQNKKGKSTNIECFVSSDWNAKRRAGCVQFLKHPNFRMYRYTNRKPHDEIGYQFSDDMSLSDTCKAHGAYLCRLYRTDITKKQYDEVTSGWQTYRKNGTDRRYNTLSVQEKRDAWSKLLMCEPGTLGMETYIVMLNHMEHDGWWNDSDTDGAQSPDYHIGPGGYGKTGNLTPDTDDEDCRQYPFFTYTTSAPMAFGDDDDAFIVISGSVLQHCFAVTPYPLTGTAADGSKLPREGDNKYQDQFFNWSRLKTTNSTGQNKYWNGTSWQTTPCDFKLWFEPQPASPPPGHKNNDNKYHKTRTWFDNFWDFCNESEGISWTQTKKGYYIPVKEVLTGNIELTLYCQRDMWGNSKRGHWNKKNKWNRYYSTVQVIRGFNVSFEMSNTILDQQENNTDTIYTNHIESDSCKEADEITFKLTTFDDKNQSYSTVYFTDDSGQDRFVDCVYNKAFWDEYRNTAEGSTDGTYRLRPEEMLIQRMVTQYEKPRVIYRYNLNSAAHKIYGLYTDSVISDRAFIATEINTDYRYGTVEIKLTEKA